MELVRSHGARLVGPNCLGLINTHADVSLNASLAPAMAARGRIGFFSHSAALGLVILKYAEERGLGFSSFVSAGNRGDVSGNDLLQYWEEDPATDIALLYLETFGNPRRFARIARRIAHRKPILCVKSARSRAGRDVARAHIGAVAQSDTNVDMLFRQAGVIRAETLEEMFDVAALLASQPLPRGDRVAIVSNSGGVLTICADACESHGLVVAGPGVLDLGPLVTVKAYEEAVQGDARARGGGRPHRDLRVRGELRRGRRRPGHPARGREGRAEDRRREAGAPLPHGGRGDRPVRLRGRGRLGVPPRLPLVPLPRVGRARALARRRNTRRSAAGPADGCSGTRMPIPPRRARR